MPQYIETCHNLQRKTEQLGILVQVPELGIQSPTVRQTVEKSLTLRHMTEQEKDALHYTMRQTLQTLLKLELYIVNRACQLLRRLDVQSTRVV